MYPLSNDGKGTREFLSEYNFCVSNGEFDSYQAASLLMGLYLYDGGDSHGKWLKELYLKNVPIMERTVEFGGTLNPMIPRYYLKEEIEPVYSDDDFEKKSKIGTCWLTYRNQRERFKQNIELIKSIETDGKITPKQFKAVAERLGQSYRFEKQPEENIENKEILNAEIDETIVLRLNLLQEGAIKFWSGVSEEDWNKGEIRRTINKDAIIDWFIEHNMNRTNAKHAQSMITPDFAKKGGNIPNKT